MANQPSNEWRLSPYLRFEQIGEEWLALDAVEYDVHRMRGPSAEIVRRLASGETTLPTDLTGAARILQANGILVGPSIDRRLLLKGALYSAGAAGLSSLFLPSPAAAASPTALSGGDDIQQYTENPVYRAHTFTASGDLILNRVGTLSVQYLIIAGGGGGGASQNTCNDASGGGGGAGGVLIGTTTLTRQSNQGPQDFAVTVGLGGNRGLIDNNQNEATGNGQGVNGGDSTFISVTATGGGGGGSYTRGCGAEEIIWGRGRDGGSGGGSTNTQTAGLGTVNQGRAGGVGCGYCCTTGGQRRAGGGGGVAGEGQSTNNCGGFNGSGRAGNGGASMASLPANDARRAGRSYRFGPASANPLVVLQDYAGGGGGGRWNTEDGGAGGGGGAGKGQGDGRGGDAAANSGSGGGGGGSGGGFTSSDRRFDGGDGGSGIVIVRYVCSEGC